MDISKDWDMKAHNWSDSISAGYDRINDLFGMPVFINNVGKIDNLKVLDAGCGEGRSTRNLAKCGAIVTGVDISQAMIDQARKKENELPLGINYFHSSCENLICFEDESFDIITSYMALMDTSNLVKVFKEFYRVLKPGRFLEIMVRHPCFFSFGWKVITNNLGDRVAMQNSNYFLRKPYKEGLKFSKQESQEFQIVRFPYTISDYIQTLIVSGFKIESILEPRPTEQLCEAMPNLKFWREHASLYLYLKATKIES